MHQGIMPCSILPSSLRTASIPASVSKKLSGVTSPSTLHGNFSQPSHIVGSSKTSRHRSWTSFIFSELSMYSPYAVLENIAYFGLTCRVSNTILWTLSNEGFKRNAYHCWQKQIVKLHVSVNY